MRKFTQKNCENVEPQIGLEVHRPNLNSQLSNFHNLWKNYNAHNTPWGPTINIRQWTPTHTWKYFMRSTLNLWASKCTMHIIFWKNTKNIKEERQKITGQCSIIEVEDEKKPFKKFNSWSNRRSTLSESSRL
jgi:hypothetical protein